MNALPAPGRTRAGQSIFVQITVIMTIFSLATMLPSAVSASDDPAALVPGLEEWLMENSPYPARPTPPRILLVEPADALTLDRHTTRFGNRLRGLYDEETSTIFLLRPWSANDPVDVGVLLHELTHHRQVTAKHWYCPQAQEWDAYKLQARWLAELGLESGFYWPAIALESSCTPKDIHPD